MDIDQNHQLNSNHFRNQQNSSSTSSSSLLSSSGSAVHRNITNHHNQTNDNNGNIKDEQSSTTTTTLTATKQQQSSNQRNQKQSTTSVTEKEMVGGCVVCGQDEGYLDNVIIYCDGDGCEIGVHEACYGITTIPKGEWYCTPCSINQKPEKCELCPARYGAFKPTANGRWCHVVCALYIPEVEFENINTMEPIVLDRIDARRVGCVCILCEMSGKDKDTSRSGCCMSCHYPNCPNKFHVTWYEYCLNLKKKFPSNIYCFFF